MTGMIVKAAGICLIMGSSTAMGFLLSGRLEERIEELECMKKMLMQLKGEIRYHHAMLPEGFRATAGRMENLYGTLLKNVSEEMEEMDGQTLAQIWEKNVRVVLKESALSKEDKERLVAFGGQMGYLDIEMQINSIELYMEQLQEEIKNAKEGLKRNGKLYRTMGVIAGIFVVILIV